LWPLNHLKRTDRSAKWHRGSHFADLTLMRHSGGENRFARVVNFQPAVFAPSEDSYSRTPLPLSKDALHDRLDGEVVACGLATWRIEVYGIVEGDSQRWIQLGLEGFDKRNLLVKLAYRADGADVVTAVQHWLAGSERLNGDILTIAECR
jgi:hypothetical protein